jgi:hypothetical protein
MDLPALLSNWFGLTNPADQRAAITGVFQMAGVFVTGMVALFTLLANLRSTKKRDREIRAAERQRDERLREAEQQRDERLREAERQRDERLREADRERESQRRRQRQRDLMIAFRAELLSIAARYQDFDFDGLADATATKVETADQGSPFFPFVPRFSDALLWKSLATELPLLPEKAIETLVLYHDTRAALQLFVGDMNSEAFTDLSAHRRAHAYRDYVEILKSLHFYASTTIERIDENLATDTPQ